MKNDIRKNNDWAGQIGLVADRWVLRSANRRHMPVGAMAPVRISLLIACVLLATFPCGAAPLTIYATGGAGTDLVTIDATSGAAHVVGPLGITGAPPLAFDPSGTLYTIANALSTDNAQPEQLATVDPVTGQATLVGSPFPVHAKIMPMAVSDAGTIFAAGILPGSPLADMLLTIDRMTGQPSVVGPLGVTRMMDFAFHRSGTLYGTTETALYQIDTATGAAELVANYSGASGVMGITFDQSDNLYATNLAKPSSLFQVDPTTGVATTIGSTGINNVHSADIMPLPKPVTIYSTGNAGTNLVTVDSATGEAKVIGPLGITGAPPLAFDPSGTLYTIANALSIESAQPEQLATVDPLTGKATLVGSPFPGHAMIMPLAVSQAGTIYGAGILDGSPLADRLLTIDRTTGQPSVVGPLGVSGMMDFAFHPSGMLYGTTTSALYQIDTMTGAAALVANYAGASGVMGITFDQAGNLYATNLDTPSLLFQVDPTTGVATTIGSTGFDYVHSADLDPVQLQAGDADMDLDFDQLDLAKVQVAAKYLTGQQATWGQGDWNGAPGGRRASPPRGDGLFNQRDIVAALATGNYLAGPYGALRPNGMRADGQTSLVYDPRTGELAVDSPAGTNLTSINIDSAAGIFTGAPAMNLGGSFDNDKDNNIFKATFGSSFGSISFGNVAQSGLSKEFVMNDLAVVGSLAGGGALGEVDLVYVPEPSTWLLIMFGALGVTAIAGRRRPLK